MLFFAVSSWSGHAEVPEPKSPARALEEVLHDLRERGLCVEDAEESQLERWRAGSSVVHSCQRLALPPDSFNALPKLPQRSNLFLLSLSLNPDSFEILIDQVLT